MAQAYEQQKGPHDVPYQSWLWSLLKGLAIFLYFGLLSGLVLWAVNSQRLVIEFIAQ